MNLLVRTEALCPDCRAACEAEAAERLRAARAGVKREQAAPRDLESVVVRDGRAIGRTSEAVL